MDVFQQNWNQQIKENPLVNKILNNTKPTSFQKRVVKRERCKENTVFNQKL